MLTDEEADELIRECRPVFEILENGSKIGKIFFESYRAMLMDTGLEVTKEIEGKGGSGSGGGSGGGGGDGNAI